MAKRLFGLLSLLIWLAACANNPAPAPVAESGAVIEWDRKPETIVFRADVTGGNGDPFLSRNEIPPCTIYGDNHIVWTNELGPFNIQVLEDRLSDDQIREFVNFMALSEQYYKYTPRADNAPASDVSPVVETLALFVNNVNHVTDAFSGWTFDYYQRLLRQCQGTSRAPALYEPAAAYVSAQVVGYDPTAPGIPWDAAANGLSLAELAAAGERRWITDRNVRVLWTLLRTSPPSLQFYENDVQYNVALEIPNLTRESPPAP